MPLDDKVLRIVSLPDIVANARKKDFLKLENWEIYDYKWEWLPFQHFLDATPVHTGDSNLSITKPTPKL